MRARLPPSDMDAPFPTWLIGPETQLSADAFAALSVAEIERASRFRDERMRGRTLRVRAALRALIEDQCAVPMSDQRFEVDALGKPRLMGTPDVDFSISYSGDHGLIGIACGVEIGVDLERVRDVPDARELARSCFTPMERAAVGSDFLTGWTRKEACLKALGLGLSVPLRRLTCGMVHGETLVRAASALLRVRSYRLDQEFLVSCAWRC